MINGSPLAENTVCWPHKHACLPAQLCSTLCNPTDCSPPGFSFHGIVPVRILRVRVTQLCLTLCNSMDYTVQSGLPFPPSRGSSQSRDGHLHLLHWQAKSLSLSHLGSQPPKRTSIFFQSISLLLFLQFPPYPA